MLLINLPKQILSEVRSDRFVAIFQTLLTADSAAIAQIISPLFATSKLSVRSVNEPSMLARVAQLLIQIFYLAIITTVVVPFVFLVFDQPPTPPSK